MAQAVRQTAIENTMRQKGKKLKVNREY